MNEAKELTPAKEITAPFAELLPSLRAAAEDRRRLGDALIPEWLSYFLNPCGLRGRDAPFPSPTEEKVDSIEKDLSAAGIDGRGDDPGLPLQLPSRSAACARACPDPLVTRVRGRILRSSRSPDPIPRGFLMHK